MPVNFPSSPSLNQRYVVGTRSWLWNGEAWRLETVTAGPAIPAGGTTGQALLKSTNDDYNADWATVALGTHTSGNYVETITDAGNSNISVSGSGSEGADVTLDLTDTGVAADTYGSSSAIPVITVDGKGRITGVTTAATSSTLTIAADSGSADTLTVGTDTFTISGGTGLSSAVTNNTITLNLDNTAVTADTYGSSTAIPVITVDAQGRLTGVTTAAISSSLSIGGDTGTDSVTVGTDTLTFEGGDGITTAVTDNKVSIAIDSSVVTLTGTQTLSNKTLTTPIATGSLELLGTGVTSYTPEAFSLLSVVANANAYREVAFVNQNSGSDASADFVAYNDASGAENLGSFFIDMGINSSNFSSTEYPIFPANSGYLFTAGGPDELIVQPSHLYLGTGTVESDIVFFAGGTTLGDVKATLKANTGNLLIGTINDDGLNKLQIDGGANITGSLNVDGAVYSGSTVTYPTQLATKTYVDNQVSTGFHVHESVRVEKHGNLNATYTNGGSTPTITAIADGQTLTSVGHGLSEGDVIVFDTTTYGVTAGQAYFIGVTTTDTFTLTDVDTGDTIIGLTDGTGYTLTAKANTGVGATLTNAGTQAALVISGVTLEVNNRVLVLGQTSAYQNGVYVVTDVGSASTNWILTRSSDANTYGAKNPNSFGGGDYFYIEQGSPGAGESYVCTNEGVIIFGTTNITFTLFSASPQYTVLAPLNLTGTTLSLTGVVGESNGGTGQSTVAQGDLLYGSSTNTWSKLPLGVAYKTLIVNASGTQIEWNAVALNQNAAVSGQLRLTNGGTNADLTAVEGGIVYSTNSAMAITSAGTSGQVLKSNGTSAPTWGDIAVVAVTYSATAPSSPNEGDKWIDSATGAEYTYINDGDSSQWVELGVALPVTLPSGGSTGQFLTKSSSTDYAVTWSNTLSGASINLASNTLTGSISQFNAACSDANFATLAGTETLTSKTINLSNNSLTGTVAQFNSALSDDDFVTLTGTETLTNKTLQTATIQSSTIESATFTNGYTEESVVANTGTAYTINLTNGTVQILTLTDNCTYTFPTPSTGKSFLLVQKQDGTGSRTVTWDSNVKWPSSTAPTITSTASKADMFSFVSDGTYWYARTIGQNYL